MSKKKLIESIQIFGKNIESKKSKKPGKIHKFSFLNIV